MLEVQLSHYTPFSFTDAYWRLSSAERKEFLNRLAGDLPGLADRVYFYNLFPTRSEADVMVWSALAAKTPGTAREFFMRFAKVSSGWRQFLRPTHTLWGFTRPSVYASGKSSQELNPLEGERRPYLIVYPFHKTAEWYLMSREDRQSMMNEHIRVGRQYTEITQLLLYSTGLQDQEFVVVYETEDLARFSALVTELRGVQGRKYTAWDTPIYTAVYAPQEELMSNWT